MAKVTGPRNISRVVEGPNFTSHIEELAPHFFLLTREHFWPEATILREVFASGWKLFILDKAPEGLCLGGKTKIKLTTTSMAIFLPSHTIVEWHIPPGLIRWQSYISDTPLRFCAPGAMVFKWQSGRIVGNLSEIDQVLQEASECIVLEDGAASCAVAAQTKRFLDRFFSELWTMPEVAEQLKLPYSTMTHYFKRAYGLSPSEYRQRLRITAAGALIARGEISATAACFQAGYGDYSNFKMNFKSVLGTSPQGFRIPWPHEETSP